MERREKETERIVYTLGEEQTPLEDSVVSQNKPSAANVQVQVNFISKVGRNSDLIRMFCSLPFFSVSDFFYPCSFPLPFLLGTFIITSLSSLFGVCFSSPCATVAVAVVAVVAAVAAVAAVGGGDGGGGGGGGVD